MDTQLKSIDIAEVKLKVTNFDPGIGAFPQIAKSDYHVRHVCLSIRLSARLSACNNSTPTSRIPMKFDIWIIFENLSKNSS
jgi:hypothetical protein